MPLNLPLKLLELTSERRAVNITDLSAPRQVGLNAKLNALRERGLVSLSNGVLSMDGRQRMLLAEQLIHNGGDPRKVTRLLGWREFEDFAEHTLSENGFLTAKHFVFKSESGRREIDILAWSDTVMLALDCKHWLRGLSTGRMKDAAQAQIERAAALARRPDLLYGLKVGHPERRSIIPVILALGDLRERIVEGVPVVSVSKMLSFIYGVSPVDDAMKRIRVRGLGVQDRLG